MMAIKYVLKHQSEITKNEIFKIAHHIKKLPHIFNQNATFVPEFSRLPVGSVF